MVLHVTIFILYAPNVQNNSIYKNINPKIFIFLGLKSLDRLRGLFAPAYLRAGAVSRTEDASGTAGAVHSLWSRLSCGPLMRRVPEKAVFGTEYLFRTVEACFLHRMLQKMRHVPQEPVLRTARTFRTVEGGFWFGALPKTHRTWLSGAQESGWQLPLRGLSTPGRGRGKLPPQRSLAYILVDLIQDTKSRPSRNDSRSIQIDICRYFGNTAFIL